MKCRSEHIRVHKIDDNITKVRQLFGGESHHQKRCRANLNNLYKNKAEEKKKKEERKKEEE